MPQLTPGMIFMALAVFFFSLTHFSVKVLSHLPFYELVFCRAIISFSMCLWSLKKQNVSPWGNNKKLLVGRGVAGTIALLCYFYTLQVMPLASAVTIQYLSPILTVLISAWLLKENASGKQWVFFLLAFIGVMLVKGFDYRVSVVGLILGVLAAIGSAIAYNFVRMLRTTEHPLVIVFYFPLITLPLVGPFAIKDWVWPQGWDWLFVLAVGVFTQLAQVNMTKAFQLEKAANISIINYLGLVLALSYGFFFFNETFSLGSLLGMGLIFIAVLLSTLVKAKKAST